MALKNFVISIPLRCDGFSLPYTLVILHPFQDPYVRLRLCVAMHLPHYSLVNGERKDSERKAVP